MSVNMSYCRFQNTLEALRECQDALGECENPDTLDELSEDERKAARRLIRLCGQLSAEFERD